MMTSRLQTRLAKLRKILKIRSAKAFLEILNQTCELSLSALEKMETGRLAMSEPVAMKISHATGVSYAWLLGTGAEGRPVTERSICGVEEPFKIQHFERRQADLLADKIPGAKFLCPILRDVPTLWALFNTAQSRDGQDRLFVYRWRQFMAGLADDFGGNEDVEKVGQRWVESLPAPWKDAEIDIVAGANFVPPREVSSSGAAPAEKKVSRKVKRSQT